MGPGRSRRRPAGRSDRRWGRDTLGAVDAPQDSNVARQRPPHGASDAPAPAASPATATPSTAASPATSIPTDDPSATFRVAQPAFEGGLGELAYALREGRVAPGEIDLLALVGDFLAFFERWAERDLDVASEALPKVALVIDLKVRLLLPRPPRVAEDDDDPEVEQALEAVALLEELEQAIGFLRQRRDQRRFVLPARTPRPDYPRAEPPIRVGVGRLSELASRLRASGYFELAVERLTLASAMKRLLQRVRLLGRGALFRVYGCSDWATRTVVFAGMLELVKENRLRAEQEEAFGEITVEPVADGREAGREAGREVA